MKILHTIDSEGLYGAENMLLTLAHEQRKLGLEPIIGSIGARGDYSKQLEIEALRRGLEIIKFRMMPGINLFGIREMIKYVKLEKVDIIHSHGYKTNIFFGLLPRKMLNLSMVATLHGWTCATTFSKLKLYEFLDVLSLRFIHNIVGVNENIKKHTNMSANLKKKIQVVNNGLDLTTDEDETAQSALDASIVSFCKKGYTIGAIGRLSREKNFTSLLMSLKQLLNVHKNMNMVIIGEGRERTELERLIKKLGISSKVLLPGYRDHARHYIKLFDIFALSSITEGLPITLLEAMQAKIPIVATAVGGIPDVIHNHHSGLLVPKDKPELITRAILRLWRDTIFARTLSERAYADLIANYSSTKMAKEYLRIYKREIQSK